MTDETLSVQALLDRASKMDLKNVVVIGENPEGAGYLASTADDADLVLAALVNAMMMLAITCYTADEPSLH